MEKPILLKTLAGEYTERPPFWFMRQAGRVLPSYMALKEKYSFWQMMKDPKLGAEVTMLPIHDLGTDAAILFSDILVIPYAMGMGLEFTDDGPVFETALAYRDNPLENLNPDPSRLEYIYKVIDEIMATKPAHIPLIGFCGGPLTVLLYMLEGIGRNAEFPEATKFIFQNKKVVKTLVEIMTDLTIIYARGQKAHGIEVFQLFETHAGLIPWELYEELFLPSVQKVADELRNLNLPFIYFPKGAGTGIQRITPDHCDFLSIDWQTPLEQARELVHPEIGLQGNIDPRLLLADHDSIKKGLEPLLDFGAKHQNWILNLGHGFKPGIPYENIQFMVDWIKQANWGR